MKDGTGTVEAGESSQEDDFSLASLIAQGQELLKGGLSMNEIIRQLEPSLSPKWLSAGLAELRKLDKSAPPTDILTGGRSASFVSTSYPRPVKGGPC